MDQAIGEKQNICFGEILCRIAVQVLQKKMTRSPADKMQQDRIRNKAELRHPGELTTSSNRRKKMEGGVVGVLGSGQL